MTFEGKTVLITGANRGIGLELARQFAAIPGTKVIGTARNPDSAKELAALGENVEITQLDVTDPASIKSWASSLKTSHDHIDVLYNNAGAMSYSNFGDVTQEEMLDAYKINTVGPFLVVQELVGQGLLGGETPSISATQSSILGSIAQGSGLYSMIGKENNTYAYNSSKTAVNMLVKCLATELADKNIISVSIHPGYVQTDMTNHDPNAIAQDVAVKGIISVLGSDKDLQGAFYSYDGSALPW